VLPSKPLLRVDVAHCLSVRRERLSRGDRCLLDTSVIVFVVFEEQQATSWNQERAAAYEEFIERGRKDGVEFLWSPLSFSELTNFVERYYLKRYQRAVDQSIDRKRFRAIPEQRKLVIDNVKEAWQYVKRLALPTEFQVDAATADAVLALLTATSLDGYDALLIRSMRGANVPYILSDDADYASAPNVIVYSANEDICE
jgi:predicted nucleic acid-binding protein